jgi:hypothetical protein
MFSTRKNMINTPSLHRSAISLAIRGSIKWSILVATRVTVTHDLFNTAVVTQLPVYLRKECSSHGQHGILKRKNPIQVCPLYLLQISAWLYR